MILPLARAASGGCLAGANACVYAAYALAPVLHGDGVMRAIGEDLKAHVDDVLSTWEGLVREQPWYSLPAEHRVNNLPAVVAGLVEAAILAPSELCSHRQKVEAAAEHGAHRRQQGIPEHLIFTEYHLLRQAIWLYLVGSNPPSDEVTRVMMRIDVAITLSINASLWGYHRDEIVAMGKWETGIERIVTSSPLLRGLDDRRAGGFGAGEDRIAAAREEGAGAD
jgi:hypothetical protein